MCAIHHLSGLIAFKKHSSRFISYRKVCLIHANPTTLYLLKVDPGLKPSIGESQKRESLKDNFYKGI